MSILHLTNVDTTQGSAQVTVNDAGAAENLSGYGNGNYQIDVDGFNGIPYQIIAVSGNVLTLDQNAPVTGTGRSASISVGLAPLVELQTTGNALRNTAVDLININEAWLTSTNETETIADSTGVERTVTTNQAVKNAVQNANDATNGILAMREVDWEAMLEHNRSLYNTGFVEFGKHRHQNSPIYGNPINNGLWSYILSGSDADILRLGWDGSSDKGTGTSKTDHPIVHINGSILEIKSVANSLSDNNNIKFPEAPNGLQKADGTGEFADLAAAITAGGNDLTASVTERKDLFILEIWDELISDKDVVYPYGLVQYGSTNLDNIITTGTDHAAQGYYAFHEGDTTTKGYGSRWSTLSDENKEIYLSDPRHNIRNTKDGLVQRRCRARTIAGLQGDWYNTDVSSIGSSNGSNSNFLSHGAGIQVVKPQGSSDVSTGLAADTTTGSYSSFDAPQGTWLAKATYQGESSVAYNGYCVALPVALVQRRNTLAYHPSHNPAGSALRTVQGGDVNTGGDAQYWSSGVDYIANLADCATYAMKTSNWNGAIGSTDSGRTNDGYFYDSIQASDVLDLRVSAHKKTPEQITAEAIEFATSGKARGWEGTAFTTVQSKVADSTNAAGTSFQTDDTSIFSVGDKITVLDTSNNILVKDQVITQIVTNVGVIWVGDSYNRVSGTTYIAVNETTLPYHQAKGGTTTDLIGSPSNIAATFPNGVEGRWIPEITGDNNNLNKKAITDGGRVYTGNMGDTWSSASGLLNTTNNTGYGYLSGDPNRVSLISYTYSPNFTEPTANAEVAERVLSDVFASNSENESLGSILAQSTINKIPTSTANPKLMTTKLNSYQVTSSGELYSAADYSPTHNTINLAGVDSPTLKAIFYPTIENGRTEINVLYKEMVFDSSADSVGNATSVSVNTAYSYVAGTDYYLAHNDFGKVLGNRYRCLVSTSKTASQMSSYNIDSNGDIYINDVKHFELWDGNGFGDNNKFIVASNDNVTTDENGNTIKYGTHRLLIDGVRYGSQN